MVFDGFSFLTCYPFLYFQPAIFSFIALIWTFYLQKTFVVILEERE